MILYYKRELDTEEHPTEEPPVFHLLVQLLHPHKLEVLSFKNFMVKTFADTVGNILSHVNHFQCIEIFPYKIPVIFDQIASVQHINATDVTNVYTKFFDKFSLPYSLVILDNTLNL